MGYTECAGRRRGECWGRAQKSTRCPQCPPLLLGSLCHVVAPSADVQWLKPELAIPDPLVPFAQTPPKSGRPWLPVLTLVAVTSEVSLPPPPAPVGPARGSELGPQAVLAAGRLSAGSPVLSGPRRHRQGVSKPRSLGPLCCPRVCTSDKFSGDAVMGVQGPR